jgi:uncharacterized protein YnzC (UPF0291/DUF896 family)
MTNLENAIAELEEKQKKAGLTTEEKATLEKLQDQWIEVESSRFGQCLSCFN